MAIEHKNISEANLHEPKGVSTASSNTSYFADGVGSGVWSKVDIGKVSGLEPAQVGDTLRVGSSGTIVGVKEYAIGSMVISNNVANFNFASGAGDATLNDNADYVLLTGTGAPWEAADYNEDVTFSVDRLTINRAGLYKASIWGNIESFPSNTTRVGFKWRLNGTEFSERAVKVKSNSANDYGILSAFAYLHLEIGDYIQIVVASSVSGNMVLGASNLALEMVRAA